MTVNRQIVFWAGLFVLLFILLAVLRDILLPFVVGAAIAYFLDPLADRLEKLGLSRLLSTVLIVSLFGILFVLGAIFLLPLLIEQLIDLAGKLPGYIQSTRELAGGYLEEWLGEEWLKAKALALDGNFKEIAEKLASLAGTFASSLWSGGLALVNFLALFVITPVVAFYLLLDWDRMMEQVSELLPRDHAETIGRLGSEINDVISGFVRGQVTVLSILGLFYILGLTMIGLNYGLLIGFAAGLISFIPFVGPAVGFIVGGVVAVVQFWPEWQWIAAVLGVFLAGQAIEGNVLSPMIVGDRVRLHPVWLIFALFVFGYLFGFVGMLLAVPLAAAIGVLVRFGLGVYLESPLYLGEPKPQMRRRRQRSEK